MQTSEILQAERNQLSETLAVVQRQLDALLESEEKIDAEIHYLLKHYTHDSVDMFDQLVVGTDLQRSAKTRIKNHMRALGKPFFARIDFSDETTQGQPRAYYIGKHGVMDNETMEPAVIDWRAPVSTLYYEGVLGPCSYDTPEGSNDVLLSLKRQFEIEDGELIGYYDVDLVANDELLQKVLGTSAESRLKEVVSTIQHEQNQIIRRTPWRTMIVQGVAGSGKTTVALHRIAYIVFNYEKELPPERFLIIGPNKFFLNYISNVLPDLGVEEVRQVTYEDVFGYMMDDEFQIAHTLDLIDAVDSAELRKQKQAITFKGSMDFKRIMDKRLEEAVASVIESDIVIDGVLIYTKKQLRDILDEHPELPLAVRVKETNKYIVNRIKQCKDEILANVMQSLVNQAFGGEGQDIELDRRCTLHMRQALKNNQLKPYTADAQKMYYAFVTSPEFASRASLYTTPEITAIVAKRAAECRRNKQIDKSDIAPILYLHHWLHGFEAASKLKQIIVDEAQDLSLFAVYTLKTIAKYAFFTLLGDVCQGIFEWEGIPDWQALREEVFEEECDFFTLEKSYRSTMEIMAQANTVLTRIGDGRYKADCVERHGAAVAMVECERMDETMAIVRAIRESQERGMRSCAVIGRSAAECAALHGKIAAEMPEVMLITGSDAEYHGGVSVLPIYLAKGMEFDSVIVTDAGKMEEELKLMYVALTRALNELTLIYIV